MPTSLVLFANKLNQKINDNIIHIPHYLYWNSSTLCWVHKGTSKNLIYYHVIAGINLIIMLISTSANFFWVTHGNSRSFIGAVINGLILLACLFSCMIDILLRLCGSDWILLANLVFALDHQVISSQRKFVKIWRGSYVDIGDLCMLKTGWIFYINFFAQ